MKPLLKATVQRLLKVSPLRFAVLFLIVAVLFSVMIVLTIDYLWDGRLNLELEFAGIITPFIDGLLIVIFITAMFGEIRAEVEKRKTAEESIRRFSEGLEGSVAEKAKLIGELQEALQKVKTLSGLLPICASCKKIRDDKGYWSQIEGYIQTHSEATFTHGLCPECMKIYFPETTGREVQKKSNHGGGGDGLPLTIGAA